jgi:hypothetical protein
VRLFSDCVGSSLPRFPTRARTCVLPLTQNFYPRRSLGPLGVTPKTRATHKRARLEISKAKHAEPEAVVKESTKKDANESSTLTHLVESWLSDAYTYHLERDTPLNFFEFVCVACERRARVLILGRGPSLTKLRRTPPAASTRCRSTRRSKTSSTCPSRSPRASPPVRSPVPFSCPPQSCAFADRR